jgi:non-homologous end joining protein Ku
MGCKTKFNPKKVDDQVKAALKSRVGRRIQTARRFLPEGGERNKAKHHQAIEMWSSIDRARDFTATANTSIKELAN